MSRQPRFSQAAVLVAIALVPGAFWSACSQAGPTATNAESLAAWQEIVTVLQHPRCLNCHQVESPLQGDAPHAHIPHVVRGPDDHGVSALRCGNCHNEMGNNPTSGTPGAPHWALAPLAMNWQGLSSGQLCAQIRDPSRNGHRDGDALIDHMANDKLVGWGWEPGAGRAPVPIPRPEFADLVRTWVAGGSACPQG